MLEQLEYSLEGSLSGYSDPTAHSKLLLRGSPEKASKEGSVKNTKSWGTERYVTVQRQWYGKHSDPFTKNSHIHYAFDPPCFLNLSTMSRCS